jgi:preprotein translocase subunit SecY
VTRGLERRWLQVVVAIACLVPLCAGAAGVLFGPRMVASSVIRSPDLDSHFRYLSGLLLGVGVGFVSTIPTIERRGDRFRRLTAIVVLGGIGRLMSLLSIGAASPAMSAALVMELLVTPALALWQWRLEGRAA